MPTPQNGQTQSNNLSAVADELFECVWSFYGVGALRVKLMYSEVYSEPCQISKMDSFAKIVNSF